MTVSKSDLSMDPGSEASHLERVGELCPIAYDHLYHFEPPRVRVASPDLLRFLTPREFEVMCLVAQGLTNGQVSRRLKISYQTVKNHQISTMAKIGVSNRTLLALWAARAGVVRLVAPKKMEG